MKYIIIGLGDFGSSLAKKLTSIGHEIIGVDIDFEKIENIKDNISYTLCMDCRQEEAVSSLPLKNTDAVIIAIGQNTGENILVAATLKKLGAKRIICRCTSPIHKTILNEMNIIETIYIEEEAAERWTNRLSDEGTIDSLDISSKYTVTKVKVPESYVGKTIQEIGFNKNYETIILSVLKGNSEDEKIKGIVHADTVLEENDVLVIYGNKSDIKKVMEKNN